MTNYLGYTSTFSSVGPRSSLLSTNPETSRRAPESPMDTKGLPASNDTRRHTRLQHRIAAESKNIQPPAKRQKTSTIESDINSNVSSTQPATPDGPPLFSSNDTQVKREVIVIKDEDEEHAEETLVADETPHVETHQPSNNPETPSKYSATLSTIQALELAEKCVDEYAGRHTKELEEKLKAFIC